ncbi:MAG: zf-HC2 domain-containing protein [Planctomycetota bacterium]
MLRCADATRRLSEALDHPLSWSERLWLRFHVLLCGACRRYERQIRAVDSLLRRSRAPDGDGTSAPTEPDPLALSPDRREAIQRVLARKED